jgi:manganese/zinc/iron transport system substrate-binding protein
MNTCFRHSILGILAIFCAVFLITCTNPQHDGKIRIVATTGIIGDVLKSCLDSHVVIEVLMKPGVDPHLYKATAGDVKLLLNADIIIHNGLHLEGKMGEVLQKLSAKKVVLAMSDQLPKHRLRMIDGAYDPHLWFDVELWNSSLKGILHQIKKKFPHIIHSNSYRIKNYADQLHRLDQHIDSMISVIPKDRRYLITAHDAFGYFGHAYDIQVIGLQGMSTLSEFGMNDLMRIGNLILEKNIRSIFVEMSIAPRSMEALLHNVRSRGGNVHIGGNLYADALDSPGTKAGTYIGMCEHNVSTIQKALK